MRDTATLGHGRRPKRHVKRFKRLRYTRSIDCPDGVFPPTGRTRTSQSCCAGRPSSTSLA